jgi:predicted  nucleic acid-binding Zn-ribbon protein
MAKLQNELEALLKRAVALSEKLAAAEAELTAATEARQRHLVEGDLEDVKAARTLQDAVNVAASQVVGFEDGLAAVNAQVGEIEHKIEMERNAADRASAAEKLARQIAGVENAIPDFMRAGRALASALSEIGYWHFESGHMESFIVDALTQIEIAAGFSLAELRPLPDRIQSGEAEIPMPPRH